MIQKVKNFFAGFASLAAFLYAAGYIAEYGHARLLGISMVAPPLDYYLIAGGRFIVSTLYALYTVLKTHFYYFLLFFIIIAAILRYEAAARKRYNPRQTGVYAVFVVLLTIIFLGAAIPLFTSTFTFSHLLLPAAGSVIQQEPAAHDFLGDRQKELKTWIVNDSPANKHRLAVFYVLLLFSTLTSAVMLHSMIRQRQRWKGRETEMAEEPESDPPPASFEKNRLTTLLTYLPRLGRHGFGLLIILMAIVVVVQAITIPLNYGILIQSNYYPEVEVTVTSGSQLPLPGPADGDAKMWLLRENQQELLLYGVFAKNESGEPGRRLFVLKKNLVQRLDISGHGFVFQYK